MNYLFLILLVLTFVMIGEGGFFGPLMPKEEDFSRALYTFDIGQNDLTYGYFSNMSTDEVTAYVPDVLDQFKTVIKVITIRIFSPLKSYNNPVFFFSH